MPTPYSKTFCSSSKPKRRVFVRLCVVLQDKSGGDDLNRGEGVGDPVLDFKLDLDDRGVKLAWESTEVTFIEERFFHRTSKEGERLRIVEKRICRKTNVGSV